MPHYIHDILHFEKVSYVKLFYGKHEDNYWGTFRVLPLSNYCAYIRSFYIIQPYIYSTSEQKKQADCGDNDPGTLTRDKPTRDVLPRGKRRLARFDVFSVIKHLVVSVSLLHTFDGFLMFLLIPSSLFVRCLLLIYLEILLTLKKHTTPSLVGSHTPIGCCYL